LPCDEGLRIVMSYTLKHFFTYIWAPSLRCHVMRGWGLPWATHSSTSYLYLSSIFTLPCDEGLRITMSYTLKHFYTCIWPRPFIAMW
jgi:hypothetical protein